MTPSAADPIWTKVVASGPAPAARSRASLVHDPVRDRLLVFGGQTASAAYSNEVWELTLTGAPRWTQLDPEGSPPGGRILASVFHDPLRDRMVV